MEDINLNTLCTCFHCRLEIGTLNTILEGIDHECFHKFDEITFDCGSNVVKGIFKQSAQNNAPAATTSVATTSAATTTLAATTSNWTDPAIKLLISTYKECEEAFLSPQHNKKTVWAKISKKLEEHGIYMTATKCDEKWRNMKKKYDAVRRANQKTGNSSSNWRFFDELHAIFLKDPLYSPLTTVSSTGKITIQQLDAPISSTPSSSKSKYSPTGLDPGITFTPKKNKRRSTYSSIEELERKRQARHEEKMMFKREVFEWLKASEKKNNDPSFD